MISNAIGDDPLAAARDRLARGDLAGARALLEAALQRQPGLPPAELLLAAIEADQGALAPARVRLETLTSRHPGWHPAWVRLAAVTLALGEPAAAATAARRALALAADDDEALELLGTALERMPDGFRELVAVRRRQCERAPGAARPALRLAHLFRRADLLPEAHAAWVEARRRDPENLPARWAGFQLPPRLVWPDAAAGDAFLARWRAELAAFADLPLEQPTRRDGVAGALALATPFHSHYLLGPDPVPLRDQGRLIRRMALAVAGRDPLERPPARAVRLRVGFVSAYFRVHTVGRLFERFITGLDRRRFAVSVFHLDDRRDALTARLAAAADHLESGERDPRRWLATIAAHPLDVLVFTDVGMHPTVQLLAALRLAPVQLALWGHPVTPGLDTLDRFVTSDILEAPDGATHYHESLTRLPGIGASLPRPVPHADPPPAARADGSLRLLVPGSVYKLLPTQDAVFARIAAALPHAHLVFLPSPQAHVRAELAARLAAAFRTAGADPARQLTVAAPMAQDAFRALVAECDLQLDTIGWSGGMTALDVLAQGLPTITLPGVTFRARQTAALLAAIGAEDGIARDVDDYVARAVAFAGDRARRDAARERIVAGVGALYDDARPLAAFADLLHDLADAR